MQAMILLLIGLTGAGSGEYSRSLASGRLDQPTLDVEGYGDKKALHREDDGLRIILAPGAEETGWKSPQAMRFGGDFRLSAGFVVKTLPKPAIADGTAIGLAIAFQDVSQPDVTFIRLTETAGAQVYRVIDKASANPQQMQMQMQNQIMMMQMQMGGMIMMGGMQQGGKPAKPPRRTFPAAGEAFRLELEREGPVVRFHVVDGESAKSRYLGQLTVQGVMDVAALKLFVVNRNGAEPINVLLKDLKLRADHITGLGATVRSVYDEVVYGEPTSIEDGMLIVGGQPASPFPGAASNPTAMAPAMMTPASAVAMARVRVAGGVVIRQAGGAVMMAAPVAAVRVQAAAPVQAAASPAAAPVQVVAAQGGTQATPPAVDVLGSDAPPSAVFADPAVQAAASPPKPRAKIPLDEVESIRLERTPTLAARLIGQPNLDFTRGAPSPADAAKADQTEKKPGARKADGSDDVAAPAPGTTVVKTVKIEAAKNGIRDLQLALFGLRPAKIRQIMVNCQTDKGAASWQLDTNGSPAWPLVMHRSGTEASADLFLEPPPGDCDQKSFTININYEDNQAANANFLSDKHSDEKLAVDPKVPGVEALDAWVYLTGDEKLFGKLGDVVGEKLHLATPWNDQLEIPLERIAAVHVGLLDRKESPESFARRRKSRGSEDLLLAQTRKGEVVAIPGVLEGIKDGRLSFLYQGKSRSLPIAQVEGLVVAARPDARRDQLRPTFQMAGDVSVSGRWKSLDSAVWKVEAPWGQELNLPAAQINEVRFRGGKMTYLSDLDPTKVEEASFFGHRFPWRRDVGLTGEKLKINGETFDRGIAVHSRSSLTYDLDGRFATFEALVGFDDAARGKGRAACRVFADDKEVFADPDLRADAPPKRLKLSVESSRQLRLEVDYGRGQDTGDRVIWADARLFRSVAPRAEATTAR